MTDFAIVEARPWHCGQMLRLLRAEHWAAIVNIGANSHRELRACFDDSAFRRAWLIDGKLAGLGGVTGPTASSTGVIWLALSQAAMAHPVEVVREARHQIEGIMRTKRTLMTALLPGDEKSKRFAVFLGFAPLSGGSPAASRYGRESLLRELEPGQSGCVEMRYDREAA